jgi:hypothetical protein
MDGSIQAALSAAEAYVASRRTPESRRPSDPYGLAIPPISDARPGSAPPTDTFSAIPASGPPSFRHHTPTPFQMVPAMPSRDAVTSTSRPHPKSSVPPSGRTTAYEEETLRSLRRQSLRAPAPAIVDHAQSPATAPPPTAIPMGEDATPESLIPVTRPVPRTDAAAALLSEASDTTTLENSPLKGTPAERASLLERLRQRARAIPTDRAEAILSEGARFTRG